MSHEFLVNGRSVSVVEGDPAVLPCSIESLPPAEIKWQYNSQPLLQSNRSVVVVEVGPVLTARNSLCSTQYIILDNGTLIIKQVQKEDEGDYSCIAWNSLVNKTRVSDVSPLSVETRTSPSPLEILIPGTLRTNWTLGDNVTLACVAKGTPTPTVKWTKLLPDQSSGLVTDVTEGVSILKIQNVTASHASVYTCIASQVISQRKTNTVSITKEVVVEEILTPPVLTKKPKSQVLPTAKTIRFQCEAEGNPIPQVVWYKNGYKLHINGRIKLRDELVLSNTVSNDSGVYQCIATNSVGSVWAAARLQVNASKNQPRPPTHLTCTTLSATTVNLTWEQINPVNAFTIHLLPTDGGEERMSVMEMEVGQQNQTFTVEKLPPYTNYTFYVRSYTRNAASDNSEEVICQTGESVPKGAPQMTARPQSAMTVLVEWHPLPTKEARGVVTGYKVQWRRIHSPSSHVDYVPPDVLRYVITGLMPDTQYEVRVLAATQVGWSSLSEHEMPWTQVTTLSLTPLLPPPTVQLTVINATTIQVRWTLVSDSVHVEGFHLSYRKHNAQPTTPIQLPANTSEYLLLDLEPQTWYEVQVKGVSGMTEGEMGVRAIHTLPPLQASPAPALSPPTNLEATPTSSSSINVTWDPPLTPVPANASYYTISYLVVPSSVHGDDNNTNFLHSTSNGVQVTGLKPYTLYELKVRTHDHNNRHSEYSQTLECRTLEDVRKVAKQNSDETSRQLFSRLPPGNFMENTIVQTRPKHNGRLRSNSLKCEAIAVTALATSRRRESYVSDGACHLED
ncbi:hypothetical protein J6590_019209 [Homalodisca vitripennis]|nr:hypothetical protein J6590_019209 [Homalodisca vitripennis]